MVSWRLFLPALSLLLACSVQAEIYEWRDDGGDRHFTNLLDAVPADQRESSQVIVRERVASNTDEPAVEPAPQAPELERPREALVIYDRAKKTDDYSAGFLDGLAMSGEHAQPVSFTVNGPLAVANSEASSDGAGYPFPYYYPFVTTSFDRGRSRHLTLRMLLQDQFQLDRDGPYLYERINPVGLGPRLEPFLARGLPYRIPPGHRVLFR